MVSPRRLLVLAAVCALMGFVLIGSALGNGSQYPPIPNPVPAFGPPTWTCNRAATYFCGCVATSTATTFCYDASDPSTVIWCTASGGYKACAASRTGLSCPTQGGFLLINATSCADGM